MLDLTVVSQKKYVDGGDGTGYDDNVLLEDRLVLDALKKQGLTVTYKDWADQDFDWSSTHYVLIRCVWDYFVRYNEFTEWLAKTEGQTTLINSAEIIHWNKDKIYLKEMADNGVNITPSVFFKKGEHTSIKETMEEQGWSQAVMKPCVAGGGVDTYRIGTNNLDTMETTFHALILKQDMIVQEFQKDVAERGEISLMVFGGKYSHAVLKKAKQGDFRVQDDWGGTVHNYEPTQEEIQFAEQAIAACPYNPIYARADIFNDNQGKPALAELELIEPELWFRNKPESAIVFAKVIAESLR